MPKVIQDVVQGAVKLVGLPDRARFTSFRDFLEQLPQMLSVELPRGISGVIVSAQAPTEDDRNRVWIRRDTSGSFLGIYTFQDGKWKKLYNFVDGQIVWITGDSDILPDDFVLVDTGDATIPSYVVNALKAQYVPKATGSGYAYFAVRFSG